MPIYTFFCSDCDETVDLVLRVRELDKPHFCEECGDQMQHTPEVPAQFVRGSGSWSSPA